MANFLEQLVAEWHELRGYFVRRNILVGLRKGGGYDCELDIVAFNPKLRHLVHIEPSMDADSWKNREVRFEKKFKAGREHIPELFSSFKPLPDIEHIALFVFGSEKHHRTVGGGRVLMVKDLMQQIRADMQKRNIAGSIVPEQYQIMRALLFASEYWR